MTVLLEQYRQCSAHHILSYSLIWQAPAVTIAVSGLLVAATFAYDLPDIGRVAVTAVGTTFVAAMTLAVERYRMFQLARRRDMHEIELRLAPLGIEPIVWDVGEIANEVRRGTFEVPGLFLYRWEGFKVLRALMIGITILLFVLTTLTIADAFGLDVFE
ncbi:MAG TPA: hypothetical protein VM184_03030 [Gaiellaceae bacterium]|nr:hypothetical protein [Gaiellaceae bacterium]